MMVGEPSPKAAPRSMSRPGHVPVDHLDCIIENDKPYPSSMPCRQALPPPATSNLVGIPGSCDAGTLPHLNTPSLEHLIRTCFPPFPFSRFQFRPCRFMCQMVGAMHSLRPASQAFRVFAASPT
jgi:hypothetical protein